MPPFGFHFHKVDIADTGLDIVAEIVADIVADTGRVVVAVLDNVVDTVLAVADIVAVADTADTAFVAGCIDVVVACFEAVNTGCFGEAHNMTVPRVLVLVGNTFVLVLVLVLSPFAGVEPPSADKTLDIAAFETWVGPGVAWMELVLLEAKYFGSG